MKIFITSAGRSYDQTRHLPAEITLQDGTTLADAVAALKEDPHAEGLLPPTSLVAVDGVHVGTLATVKDSSRQLRDGEELAFISPVAGG